MPYTFNHFLDTNVNEVSFSPLETHTLVSGSCKLTCTNGLIAKMGATEKLLN